MYLYFSIMVESQTTGISGNRLPHVYIMYIIADWTRIDTFVSPFVIIRRQGLNPSTPDIWAIGAAPRLLCVNLTAGLWGKPPAVHA